MFWRVVGYVRVKFDGEAFFAFLNECRKNGAEFKNIKKLGSSYYADIISTSLKSVYKISSQYDIDISIEGRFGLAMKLFIYKNRLGFIISGLIFIILFVLNSLFIREIVITGNNYLTDKQIETVLAESGIYRGRFIPGVEPDIIKEQILSECKHLSWIWIDIKGSCANVDVREKTSVPEFYDSAYSCNIVASRDGVITEAIAETGTLCVKEGDYVKKGDILINGVYDGNEYAPVRFVRAAGTVMAKTRYTITDTYSNSYSLYTVSDKKLSSTGVGMGGWSFETNLFLPKNAVLVESVEKRIEIFGKKYLPLAFTNKKYCEIIRTECFSDTAHTKERAVKELTDRLEASIPKGASVEAGVPDVCDNGNGTVTATVTFECIENIAEENYIEVTTGS